jgi:hypothetical protein
MKQFLIPCMAIAILFSACKKDKGDDKPAPIDITNATAVSTNIKVAYSQRLTGKPPAPTASANAPVLYASSNNQNIVALSGRYAVITPEVQEGEIAGYYAKVVGSNDYFKIDYTKPRGFRKAPTQQHKGLMHARSATDYADSSIVIALPASITAGTFCVEYCAYDAQNNISNIIKVCITVSELGAGANGGGFAGTWKQSRYRNDINNVEGLWEDVYAKDYDTTTYYCINNNLQRWDSAMRNPILVVRYNQVDTGNFTFAVNGGFESHFEFTETQFNFSKSTCSNLVFDAHKDIYKETGGWSYNATTKKLVTIIDENGYAGNDFYIEEYDVIEKTSTKLVLKFDEQNGNNLYKYYYEFIKK